MGGSAATGWGEDCVSAICSCVAPAAEAFEGRASPADSKGVEALGGFSV